MSAISSRSIISKIGFLRNGSNNPLSAEFLRKEMIDYCRKQNNQYISYQAIYGWFRAIKPSRIVGQNSLLFVRDFFYDKIVRSKLTDDQKKVYDQIEKYFVVSNVVESHASTKEKISILDNGSVQIQLALSERELVNVGKTLVGNYNTYRYRFGAAGTQIIAQEVLDISVFGSQVRFRQSYIMENNKHTYYRGVVVPVGEQIWLIGLNTEGANRFRILQFRNTKELDPNSTSVRWGIVSSNIPDSINKDPASCRIVLEKIKHKILNMSDYSIDNTKFFSMAEFRHPNKDQVLRLISNHTTAHSIYGSVQPQKNAKGKKLVDTVLKVDQRTVEDYSIFHGNSK